MKKSALLIFMAIALAELYGCATPKKHVWHPTPVNSLDHPLTLDQCLKLAESQDVTTAIWRWRLKRAQAELAQARKFPNPSLGLLWEDIGLHNAEGKSLLLKEIGVSYPLFFWLTKPGEVAVAEANLREQQATVEDEKRSLRLVIGRTFYRILGEQESLELARKNVKLAESILVSVRARHGVGEATGLDMKRAELEVDRARQGLALTERRCRTDQFAFAFALGCDQPVAVRVQGTWVEDNSLQWAKGLLSQKALQAVAEGKVTKPPVELLRAAVANRPDLLAAYARINAARARLGIEQIRMIPLTDANLGAAYRDTPDGSSASVNASVPVPVFDQNIEHVRMAKADLELAEAKAEQLRRRVIAEAVVAWAEWQTALSNYRRFLRGRVELTERIANASQALFSVGEASYLDLIQAQRDLVEARQETVSAKVTLAQAQWQLQIVVAGKNS